MFNFVQFFIGTFIIFVFHTKMLQIKKKDLFLALLSEIRNKNNLINNNLCIINTIL